MEKEFEKQMESLARKHERSKVYVDFMDYYIYQNSESSERTLPNGYTDTELQVFKEAYTSFQKIMQALIEKYGWYDYIGEYYEEYVLAGHKASSKGQFYTPRGISDLLSRLVGSPVSVCEGYDPACGSARNLLDYHSKHPEVRCTGEDLDESACKMAVINFHLHGVNGVVNWIDALTREYMGTSWRIIGDKIIITDMEWIRAVDEVMQGVTILSLSDDTIKELLQLGARVLQEQNKNQGDKEDTGGLDKWVSK